MARTLDFPMQNDPASDEGAMTEQWSVDRLFLGARTHRRWQDRPVPEALLRRLWEVARWGPTSANCLPMRLVFVASPEAKERLRPALSRNNTEQTMTAPVTAVIGYDLGFVDLLPKLYPHTDARPWFAGQPALIEETAFRNGTLQGGYFILAARALGLDAGPMSGFDRSKVDEAFFSGTTIRSNFLVNLGYGDPAGLREREPRLDFEDVARFA